jgi:hypothetical protein
VREALTDLRSSAEALYEEETTDEELKELVRERRKRIGELERNLRALRERASLLTTL